MFVKKAYLITHRKLKQLKLINFRLIATDYDGTIFDRYDLIYNNLYTVLKLAFDVTQHGKEFAFVSGRNTTLEMELREIAPRFCKKNNTNLIVWRSGGNGMNLYKITYTPQPDNIKIKTIYSNNISLKEIKAAVEIYKDLNIPADRKSQMFFMKFLKKKLPEDLVPKPHRQLALHFQGKLFAESVKVTFVLPTDSKEQEKYIQLFRKKLSSNKLTRDLNVGWGRIPFADISKKLTLNGKPIDGKLLMVKHLIKELKINKSQVVTFGDAPNDNNKGLLSFPFSFTNDKKVIKKKLNSPPFVLEVKHSQVDSVYKTIKYLLK